MSKDACSRDRHSESLWNLGDGLDGLILCKRGNLGDLVNCLADSALICLVKCCLATEQLVLITPLHPGGSWESRHMSPLVAFFASSSNLSFSTIPSCLGVHQISSASLLCLVYISSIFSCSRSTRC